MDSVSADAEPRAASAPACGATPDHDTKLNLEVRMLSGHSVAIVIGRSATLPELFATLEAATSVPAKRQQLIHHDAVLMRADARTLAELGISDGECLTLAVKSQPAYSWATVGLGSEVIADSMGQLWKKTRDEPDYSGAIGSPGFTQGEHSWSLRLRGQSRCEIGVCDGAITVENLTHYLRDETWQVHFTGGEGNLGSLYLNNEITEWTGADGRTAGSLPDFDPVDGLLVRVHINIDEDLLSISFVTPNGKEYLIYVPRPDCMQRGAELFPYVNLDDIGGAFELCDED